MANVTLTLSDRKERTVAREPLGSESDRPHEQDKSGLPTASRVMMMSEDMLRLEQALDHLPAETRELMIAVKLEGRTYQELADETSKTSDAVRMQANRAMDALRDEIVERDCSAEAEGLKPGPTAPGTTGASALRLMISADRYLNCIRFCASRT